MRGEKDDDIIGRQLQESGRSCPAAVIEVDPELNQTPARKLVSPRSRIAHTDCLSRVMVTHHCLVYRSRGACFAAGF